MTAAGTFLGSALLALLAGSSVRRALTLGLYLVGSFLLLAGFFVGNRGRVRADTRATAGGVFGGLFAPRRVRGAEADEERETIGSSAILITLGVALLLLGVGVDGRHELV